MVAVVDYKLEFYETVADLRRMCLRAFDMNLRTMQWERHEGPDLSVEQSHSHSD